ncbi:MAG TPA: hypothetical protein VFE25_07900, partial [Opitutaceae bacterium]|nr:hypothetical protein [Opitutaceae bacterium]
MIAPAAAPVIYGVIAASRRPPGEGPTWINSFGQWFALVGIVSYVLSYVIGIPACIWLRRLHKESMIAYASISGIAGFLYLPVINAFRGISPELIAVSFIFAVLGATVGVSFSLLAGRANVSNQSTDPTA